MAPNPKPNVTVFTPQQVANAQAKAEARAAELRDEGFELGKKHAADIHERAKLLASGALGLIIGAALMGLYMTSLNERAAFTTGAIVRNVLESTIAQPADPVAPLTVRDAATQNLPGCSPGQIMPGGRRCPPEPASAP